MTPTQAWVQMSDTLTSAANAIAAHAAGGPAPAAGTAASVTDAVTAWALAIFATVGPTRQPRVMVPAWAVESAILQRLTSTMPADVLARQPALLDYVTAHLATAWDLYASCYAVRMV